MFFDRRLPSRNFRGDLRPQSPAPSPPVLRPCFHETNPRGAAAIAGGTDARAPFYGAAPMTLPGRPLTGGGHNPAQTEASRRNHSGLGE